MSTDTEVCLAWLAEALGQLRTEGRTKVVGYLEAVSEEVVFETKTPSRSLAPVQEASRRWEEDACSGCW